jgi:hypothetical protein
VKRDSATTVLRSVSMPVLTTTCAATGCAIRLHLLAGSLMSSSMANGTTDEVVLQYDSCYDIISWFGKKKLW